MTAGAVVAQAPDGGVEVDARLTHAQATVGDRVGLEIVVRTPPGWQVSVPNLPLRVGDLDLIERLPDETSADGNERRYRWVLSPFVTGDLLVPPIEITARSSGGEEVTTLTPTIPLRVESVIPPGDPAAEVKDLRAQAELEGGSLTIPWPIIATAAGAVAAVAILLLLLRRVVRAIIRRARRPALPAYLSAEDAARAALDELASTNLTRRTLKPYYATLSQITRRYLADRYEFPAHALTTAEMEQRMGDEGIDRWQARLVAGLLAECDSVHYAQYVPAQQRADHDLSLAYEIIELGRPRVIIDEGADRDDDDGGDDGALDHVTATPAATGEG